MYTISSFSLLPQKKREKAMSEGWEYARLAHLTYHITEHRLDFARRRRWARRLINLEPGARAVFTFQGKNEKKKKKKDSDDEDEDERKQQVPRMYLTFSGELTKCLHTGNRFLLL